MEGGRKGGRKGGREGRTDEASSPVPEDDKHDDLTPPLRVVFQERLEGDQLLRQA
jgi:hypothetical protein